MVSFGFSFTCSSCLVAWNALTDDKYGQATSKTHGSIPRDSPKTIENGEDIDSSH
jgi:hypothetical protein